ncbi:hypothetical protein ACOMHN_063212 [Nucella lapillus]
MEIVRNAKARFQEEKLNRGLESRLPQAKTGSREQKTSGKYLGIVNVKKGRDILLKEEFDSRLQSKSNPPKAAARRSENVKTYIISQRDMRLVFFLSLCLQQEMELIDDTNDSWKNLPFYPTGIAKCVKRTTDEPPPTLSTVDAMSKNPEGKKGKSFPRPLLPLQNQDHLWCNCLVQLCLNTLHRSKRAIFEATCFWLWHTGSIKEDSLREVTGNDQLFSACVQRLYLLNKLFMFSSQAKQLSLIESDRTRYFVHCVHHLDYYLISAEDHLYREVGNEKQVLQVATYPESTPELCRFACDDASQHDGVEKVSDQEKAECQNGQSDTVQDHERPKTEKKRNLRKRKVKKHWKQRRAYYATNKSVVVGGGLDGRRKGRSDSEESVERSAENITSDDFLPPQTNQKPQEASPETSQDNTPLSEDDEPSQPFSEQRIETAHIPEAVSVPEPTVVFLEKDAVTDIGEKEAVTDNGGKDAVTDNGEKDAVTDNGGKDAVTDIGEKEAVTDNGEKDAVTDNGGKDAVTDNGGKDAVTDNGGKDAVTDNGGKDAVTDNEGKDAVTDIGEKEAVTDNGGKDAVTDNGGKDAVTDNEGKEAVTDNGEKDAVTDNEGKEAVTDNGGKDAVTDNGGKDAVTDNEGKDAVTDNEGKDAVTDNGGKDAVTDNGGKEAVTDNEGKEAVTDNEGKDAVTDNEGKDAVTDNEGKDAVTDNEGKDAVTDNEGKDAVTDNEGKEAVTDNGEKDAVTDNGGKDAVTDNGGKDAVTGNEGKDDVTDNGGKDAVTDNGEKDAVTDNGGKDAVTDNGGKDAVTDNGGKDAVTGNGGKEAVTDNEGKDAVTDNEGKEAVTDNGEKDAVTDNGGKDAVTDNGGNDSVLHPHMDSGKPRRERSANNTTTTTTTTPLYVLSSPKSSLTYSYTQPITSCLTSSSTFTTRHTPRVSRRMMMLLDQIHSELTSHRRELEILTSDRESFRRAIGETRQWAYRQLTGLMTKL